MGFVFWDHFVRLARRLGTDIFSLDSISAQRSEEGLDWVALEELFFGLGVWSEERRVEMVFHRFKAAVSAAWIVEL